MRRLLMVTAALVLALATAGTAALAQSETGDKRMGGEDLTVEEMKGLEAVIETDHGKITLEFYPEAAPNHVRNFVSLAKDGFYDGTLFHRVIPGFMIQGGDPNTKGPDTSTYGTGGPGHTVDAEFSDIPHKRGIVSMARSSDPNSAGSQFFIVVKDSSYLDGKYTVFARVTDGMEVADKIVSQPTNMRDLPLERVEMKVKIREAE